MFYMLFLFYLVVKVIWKKFEKYRIKGQEEYGSNDDNY